jgi:hypothetical protein
MQTGFFPWGRVDGAGSDEVELWESSDGTWGSSDASSTSLTIPGEPENIHFLATSANHIIGDEIIADDEDISDY